MICSLFVIYIGTLQCNHNQVKGHLGHYEVTSLFISKRYFNVSYKLISIEYARGENMYLHAKNMGDLENSKKNDLGTEIFFGAYSSFDTIIKYFLYHRK